MLEFVSILCLKATVSHKNIRVGMFLTHIPYIDMPSSLPWENWHGHLSLTYELFAQFPPNKLSILLKRPGKSCVPQIGVVPRKNGIFYFM